MPDHSDETDEPEVKPDSELNPVAAGETTQTGLTIPDDRLVDLEPNSEVR